MKEKNIQKEGNITRKQRERGMFQEVQQQMATELVTTPGVVSGEYFWFKFELYLA